MAAARRMPDMDCYVSWEDEFVNGISILPPVTMQPVANFCGAHVTVEAFESRARLLCARAGFQFPSLSIRHMIDMLRDKLVAAPTLNDKRVVMQEDQTFRLLMTRGVTSTTDYNAAPLVPGRFERNTQGLHHYKIHGFHQYFMRENIWRQGQSDVIIDTIKKDGPVHGWFIYHPSFLQTAVAGKIFKLPRVMEEEEEEGLQNPHLQDAQAPAVPPMDGGRAPSHAVLLHGYGARGRKGLFGYQNNWGELQGGRGVMEAENIISVIAPEVGWAGLAVGWSFTHSWG